MTKHRCVFSGQLRRCAAIVAMSVAATIGASAASVGPFDGLSGLWAGDGTMTFASGTKERLRCRVQYVQNSITNLQQALRCASDSYRFEINAYFDSINGNLQGVWQELSQEIHGTITGTVADGQINGNLHGPGFVAQLLVITSGDRQEVSIEAAFEEIRSVAIEVRKAQN